jgi:Glycoside-hydrolase family GH114
MIRLRLAVSAATGVCLVFGSAAAAGATDAVPAYSPPPANATFDYQIGGSYSPAAGVGIVDRDRTSHPAAHAYNICYVNAFQTQAYQAAWWKTHHSDLLLRTPSGELVSDPSWPGEILLDTSTAAKRTGLAKIIGGWIDICANKGFNAVEADNLDSNTRSHHLLTVADNLAFAKLLSARAHTDGLAIAQKNDAELSARARRTAHFDFAMAESCQVYSECSYYLKAYGDEVIEIEYAGKPYRAACAARGARISVILRDINVVARGHKGYVYQAC